MAAIRALRPSASGALHSNGKCFEVVTVQHRGQASARPKRPAKDAPIALSDLIGRVERIKDMARTLRGVGRYGPEAFSEDKSELHRAACRLEDDLRKRGVGT